MYSVPFVVVNLEIRVLHSCWSRAQIPKKSYLTTSHLHCKEVWLKNSRAYSNTWHWMWSFCFLYFTRVTLRKVFPDSCPYIPYYRSWLLAKSGLSKFSVVFTFNETKKLSLYTSRWMSSLYIYKNMWCTHIHRHTEMHTFECVWSDLSLCEKVLPCDSVPWGANVCAFFGDYIEEGNVTVTHHAPFQVGGCTILMRAKLKYFLCDARQMAWYIPACYMKAHHGKRKGECLDMAKKQC